MRAEGLPDAERDHNLEMLKFISEQTVARGMQFQLGIWMHGYEWANSPHANYRITGLNARKSRRLLPRCDLRLAQACPAISGVTIRTHGESGVTEGSYEIWKTIFNGVGRMRAQVEIDLHAKGIDQTMIDTALATGMPVNVVAEILGRAPGHGRIIRRRFANWNAPPAAMAAA